MTALTALSALSEASVNHGDVRAYFGSHHFNGIFGSLGFDSRGDVLGEKLTSILKTLRNGDVISAG